MSRRLEYDGTNYFDGVYALGDLVSFDHNGERLTGRVVRVYSTRLLYHVEVNGNRYEVSIPEDNVRPSA